MWIIAEEPVVVNRPIQLVSTAKFKVEKDIHSKWN
jgi:hypothetical protein